MNFCKRLILVTIVQVSVSSIVWASSDYDDFRKELFVKLESIQQSRSVFTKETIFTKKVINESWYLKSNQSLFEAGESLIVYLREYDTVYRKLIFSEWLHATNDLFSVDDALSNQIGWGNLVVKVAICNKIINRVLEYLSTKEELTPKQLTSLLKVMDILKWHLPSERAMYYIAFRYYNFDTPSKVDSLNYKNIDLSTNRPKAVRSEMSKHYYKDKKIKEFVDLQEKSEFALSQSIMNYQDLYNKPIPLYLAATSRYHKIFWHLYLHIYLMTNSEDGMVNWELVTDKYIFSYLDKVYQSGDGFWVSGYYNDFYKNRNNNEATESLMKYFKEDRIMKKLFRGFSNRLKYINTVNSNIKTSRFSVHNLP